MNDGTRAGNRPNQTRDLRSGLPSPLPLLPACTQLATFGGTQVTFPCLRVASGTLKTPRVVHHNPRVGGSSPSSGMACRAKWRRFAGTSGPGCQRECQHAEGQPGAPNRASDAPAAVSVGLAVEIKGRTGRCGCDQRSASTASAIPARRFFSRRSQHQAGAGVPRPRRPCFHPADLCASDGCRGRGCGLLR